MQRAPIDQLHHVIQVAILFAIAVKLHDVRMEQTLERLDFLLKALAKRRIFGQVAGKEFDGSAVARRFMPPDINRAHAAAAQEPFNSVRAEFFQGHDSEPK